MYLYSVSWFTDTLIMVSLLILNKFKGKEALIKLYVHHHVIMIHIQLKFHEIQYTGYFDTAQFVNLTLIQGQ